MTEQHCEGRSVPPSLVTGRCPSPLDPTPSERYVGLGRGVSAFFSPLSSASISSVKVGSRLELSLLREKRIPLLKPRGFPYTWHHIEKPLYVAFVVSYSLWVFGDELHSLAMSFCLGDLK